MRSAQPQDTVTHSVKSVRKHYIDLNLPDSPKEDEEGIVIRVRARGVRGGTHVELRPGDVAQMLRSLGASLAEITDGVLWPKPGEQ